MGLDIYMISLNSPLLSEDTLATLFRDLPRTCLVLLEDIDATNLTHKREVISVESKTPAGPKRVREREPVSLSGLLNVIDGVGAQEGRVLVMTSNHTENIDPALLRPGRVDFSVKFGLATSHMATQLFTQMYEDKAEEAEEEMRMSLKETEDLNSLAVEFGKKVPELTFSPAALQGFLLTHQDDPHGAVEAVEGWVEERAAQDKAAAKAKEEAKAIEDAPKAIEDTPKSEVNGEKKD
jgi:chaperone BCS1